MKLLAWLLLSLPMFGASVYTAHGDNSRQSNAVETVLTPAAVQGPKFGKRGAFAVDGPVYAQPLVAAGVGGSDLLIVATMANSVYAFDATRPGTAALWRTNVGSPRTTYTGSSPFLYGSPIGCFSTPAIDPSLSAVFAVCASPTNWTLYKLNLTSGAILASATIAGQVPGTGDPSGDLHSGANVVFNPAQELQRSALTLANGKAYVAFGSFDDVRPWHGWVFGYNEADLTQAAVWCASPNSYGAGIWQAGGGLAVDASGNLYAGTGNGGYDGITGFGDSIVKLSPTLQVLDWFTPQDQAALEAADLDVSSGRAMLIGTQVVIGLKNFKVYSVSSSCMGRLAGSASGCPAPQIFATNPAGATNAGSGIYGGMFSNGRGYFPNTNGKVYGFNLAGSTSTWDTTATTTAASFSFPGAQLTGAGSLVWALTAGASAFSAARPGTLRAFDPVSLAELWNSDTNAADSLGTLVKFVSPTIANGRVYVGTLNNSVVVYGLRMPAPALNGNSQIRGRAAAR